MSEAEDEAEQIWTDIGTIFGGAGTFTPEQMHGYAKGIIATALQRHMDVTRDWELAVETRRLALDRAEKAEAERDDFSRAVDNSNANCMAEYKRAEKAEARLAAFDAWGKRGDNYRQEFNDWVHSETNIDTLRARLIAADEGADYLHMCLVEQQTREKARWDENEALAFDRDQLVEERDELRERAEKAEGLIPALKRDLAYEIEANRLLLERAESAEQRLADLIGEVVEWIELPANAVVAPWRALLEILAKYEKSK